MDREVRRILPVENLGSPFQEVMAKSWECRLVIFSIFHENVKIYRSGVSGGRPRQISISAHLKPALIASASRRFTCLPLFEGLGIKFSTSSSSCQT